MNEKMNVYKIRFAPGESRLARHFIPKIFRNFAIQFANRGINSNYDFCISLGDNCISAHLLRQNFLRKASFPFDWIAKGGISSRFSLIKNNFENFINVEDLEFCLSDEQEGSYVATNKRTGFYHPHDFTKKDLGIYVENPLECFQQIKNKYLRRIKRLYTDLSGKKVLFVYFETKSVQDKFSSKEIIDNLKEIKNILGVTVLDLIYFRREKEFEMTRDIEIYEEEGVVLYKCRYPENIMKIDAWDTNDKVKKYFICALRKVAQARNKCRV